MERMSEVIDRQKIESFARLADEMDDLVKAEVLNKKEAERLMAEYSLLVQKTCENQSLPKLERDSWAVAIAHAYEPSYNNLVFRLYAETQKK